MVDQAFAIDKHQRGVIFLRHGHLPNRLFLGHVQLDIAQFFGSEFFQFPMYDGQGFLQRFLFSAEENSKKNPVSEKA